MDEFLVGGYSWKGVPPQVLRIPIQRYLRWILTTTPIDRQLAWENTDWSTISHKDLALFYHFLFNYSQIFPLACVYMWKQLSAKEMEERLTRGELYKIEPLGFLNILRINVMALGFRGWRQWEISDVIPKFMPGEWSEIQRLASIDEI